jgi:hypothetical protein
MNRERRPEPVDCLDGSVICSGNSFKVEWNSTRDRWEIRITRGVEAIINVDSKLEQISNIFG